ncbi:TetR/AcrR family transcriptional regulator [Microbacterium sp. No. 7]|uniref:TetR/AcrR family transcriptional regulator n=1 Tax=Microbacterium sp. No. 7 TaxID=1714373 RepID=UPI0006D1BC7C|nr:TetR/AcrR family transcriptional regulator [Microbacterium sp. No. 7]ALJ21853.1 hypothetical protein AOA12_18905 [Microbacterium sp. No. 7]
MSSTVSPPPEPGSKTRRDQRRLVRRDEIVRAATPLFRSKGFAGVRMTEIAGAVGITAPALYRHFDGKQALLMACIGSGLDVVEAAIAQGGGELGATLDLLAASAVDRSDLWILVQRDGRNLDPDARADYRSRLAAVVGDLSAVIGARRADLSADDGEWLARAVLATLAAPAQYQLPLSGRPLQRALLAVSEQICTLTGFDDAPVVDLTEVARNTPFQIDAPRRESLLQHAAALIAERGYQQVTIDDIGAAADIAGPSLYHHFASKGEILSAILRRAADWIEVDRLRAMREATEPAEILQLLVQSYTALALTHSELFRIFTQERVHLPEDERRSLARVHRESIDHWVALLETVRPDLNDAVARVYVSSALCIINDMSRPEAVRTHPQAATRIAALASHALRTAPGDR